MNVAYMNVHDHKIWKLFQSYAVRRQNQNYFANFLSWDNICINWTKGLAGCLHTKMENHINQQIQENSRIQIKKKDILISCENILPKYGVSETLSEKKKCE